MNSQSIYSMDNAQIWRKIIHRLKSLYYILQYGNHIYAANATACLYKREMLEDIGLFDESFFAYCEDLELSWRAYKKGWKSKYVPNSIVYHEGGGTTKNSKKLKREMGFLFARNWAITVKRHATLLQKFVFVLVFTKTAAMSWIGMLLGKNNVGIKPYLRAFKEFLS
ncbi:MAG: N-acetylglucosaminyl-diphospho-decaprenol L-rhamnosyltransferase [candidate division WS2 bacterium]|nr:N-acetylglucosaminyl-diphospho-decaprenol L-rhamnosyltransferase [Candidatus Psychracetigena formicireducens]